MDHLIKSKGIDKVTLERTVSTNIKYFLDWIEQLHDFKLRQRSHQRQQQQQGHGAAAAIAA